MEKILQYIDDLDDLVGVAWLISERLRNVVWLVLFLSLAFVAGYCAVKLALAEPPLALAIAVSLFVILLYRSVTRPVSFAHSTA